MKKFSRLSKCLLALSVCILATACSKSSSDKTASNEDSSIITVGATSVPHAEILNQVVDNLAEEGITLNVKEFAEYTVLNKSLADGEVDANFFQHIPYLDDYLKQTGDKLVSVGAIHIEPMGIYSKSVKSLDDLKEGDKIAIPNDATNGSRALLLLQDNGLITIKEGISNPTMLDIEKNGKNFEIIEMDAAALPRTLDDVDISLINTNYALEAGFSPIEDAIVLEGKESPFANILVVREEDKDNPSIQALYNALTSDEIRDFINNKYDGAIIPTF